MCITVMCASWRAESHDSSQHPQEILLAQINTHLAENPINSFASYTSNHNKLIVVSGKQPIKNGVFWCIMCLLLYKTNDTRVYYSFLLEGNSNVAKKRYLNRKGYIKQYMFKVVPSSATPAQH